VRIGGVGLLEILILVVLFVLLFGGRGLPKAGGAAGRLARRPFRKLRWMWTALTGGETEIIRAEREYGRDCAAALSEDCPPPIGPECAAIAEQVGARLAAAAPAGYEFTFTATGQAEENAFALPGGFIFISESLIRRCGYDRAEIAFILGHEMAHVIHGDSRDRLMADALLGRVAARLPDGGRLLREALGAGYSREQELKADLKGAGLARAAGFDAAAALRALRRLAGTTPGGGALESYFASHPPVEERAAALERSLAHLS
jgi:predicted Zn-dependent protease